MGFVEIKHSDQLAMVILKRGKVNALNSDIIHELSNRFDDLRKNDSVEVVVLTGNGSFFSFGLDVPELLTYSKEEFTQFLVDFTNFYTDLYVFSKPVIAAINGHAIAGGCMLATACDYRIMASGKGKISLNEVTFGATVFAGSVEMLKGCAGYRNAEMILYSGKMYEAGEALDIGLVDQIAPPEDLMKVANDKARWFTQRDMIAFKSLKALLREPIAEQMRSREPASIEEFVKVWYSASTWEQLEKIEIRE